MNLYTAFLEAVSKKLRHLKRYKPLCIVDVALAPCFVLVDGLLGRVGTVKVHFQENILIFDHLAKFFGALVKDVEPPKIATEVVELLHKV